MPKQIVVIGAGVIGLSSALDLQEAGHAVTVLARDFPITSGLVDPRAHINYTSPWGGAHNRWVPPVSPHAASSSSSSSSRDKDENAPPPPPPPHDVRDHRLALATFRRMRALARAHPAAGITILKGIEYLERPGPEYLALVQGQEQEDGDSGSGSGERRSSAAAAEALGLEGFRVLGRAELPDERVALGFEYDTWCVNPMVYCAFLLNRFVYRGGRVVRGEVRAPEEVFARRDLFGGGGGGGGDGEGADTVVVNASGQGFGDDDVFITRGQTCLVANPCDATVTRQNADGSWTFCVPRGFEGGTVIGGTKEPGDWDPAPSPAVRARLLADFVATYPRILSLSKDDGEGSSAPALTVLQDVVGRRPTRRGGARIEREEVAPGRTVVHAYGLGGRGYEMSWGVAEMVAGLVGDAGSTRARI